MNFPAELMYTDSHEWAAIDDETAVVGITDFAQNQLGVIVFIGLPEVGDAVVAGETFADLESVKAVSEITCPVSGTVSEVNELLFEEPGTINENPYDAWFIKVDVTSEPADLMDADAYQAFCENESS